MDAKETISELVSKLILASERFTQQKLVFRSMIGVGAVVCVLGAVLFVRAMTPTPPPDVWDDGLGDVAGFLFDEDFNRLPPRERMRLITEFAARFNSGSQDDAALLAMFVADVTYDMRQQIEDNLTKLAVDMWTTWADEYAAVSDIDREDYLNQLLLEFDQMGDTINNRDHDITDEERLAKMENQAQKDRNNMRGSNSGKPPSTEKVTGLFGFYSNEVASRVGAVERGRIAMLTRDLSKHVRGESLGGDK